MPRYDYSCTKCNREWESTHFVKDRNEEYCCEIPAKLLITNSYKPNTNLYKGYSENLDAEITSRSHRKKLMKERNLEEVG